MPATKPLPFTPAEAETMTADDLVAAAIAAFHPGIALACSFQQEEAVLLDMVCAARPDARVFALDTGFLFPETYETWKAYEERYGITIEAFRGPSPEEQAAEFGDRLWERDPNARSSRSAAPSAHLMRGSPACGATRPPPVRAHPRSSSTRPGATGSSAPLPTGRLRMCGRASMSGG